MSRFAHLATAGLIFSAATLSSCGTYRDWRALRDEKQVVVPLPEHHTDAELEEALRKQQQK